MVIAFDSQRGAAALVASLGSCKVEARFGLDFRIDGTAEPNSFKISDWDIEVLESATVEKLKALKRGAVVRIQGVDYMKLSYFWRSAVTQIPVVEPEYLAGIFDTHDGEILFEGK